MTHYSRNLSWSDQLISRSTKILQRVRKTANALKTATFDVSAFSNKGSTGRLQFRKRSPFWRTSSETAMRLILL